jgi:hypothetical protein
MQTDHDTIRNALAFITGHLNHEEQSIDAALNHVEDDLRAANVGDVLVAFAGTVLVLVDRLASLHGEEPTQHWQRLATDVSATLAELENQA